MVDGAASAPLTWRSAPSMQWAIAYLVCTPPLLLFAQSKRSLPVCVAAASFPAVPKVW